MARSAAEARDAPSWSTSTTSRCRSCSTWRAAADGAALVHPDKGTNRNATWVFDSAEAGTGGDVERRPPRPSDRASSGRFRQQRLIPAFMEPRSTVVDPTGEQIAMWSATQVPHILRLMLALTGMPEHKIRVIAPDVGGGFGGKLQVTPEEVVTLLVAPPARQAGASTPRPAASRCWPPTTAATRSRTSRCRPQATAPSPA